MQTLSGAIQPDSGNEKEAAPVPQNSTTNFPLETMSIFCKKYMTRWWQIVFSLRLCVFA
jgi:hypothetical protein